MPDRLQQLEDRLALLEDAYNDHAHTGIDGKKIFPKSLKGFPIFSVEPTHDAQEGTIIFSSVAGTYKMHVYISGGWQEEELT